MQNIYQEEMIFPHKLMVYAYMNSISGNQRISSKPVKKKEPSLRQLLVDRSIHKAYRELLEMIDSSHEFENKEEYNNNITLSYQWFLINRNKGWLAIIEDAFNCWKEISRLKSLSRKIVSNHSFEPFEEGQVESQDFVVQGRTKRAVEGNIEENIEVDSKRPCLDAMDSEVV